MPRYDFVSFWNETAHMPAVRTLASNILAKPFLSAFWVGTRPKVFGSGIMATLTPEGMVCDLLTHNRFIHYDFVSIRSLLYQF